MHQVFRGRTLNEAQRAAAIALGRDAVILTTRKVARTGIAGLFGSAEFEVAAMPPRSAADAKASLPFAQAAYKSRESDASGGISDIARLRSELRNEIRALKGAMTKAPSGAIDLASELAAMRAALEELAPPVKEKRGDKVASLLQRRGIEGTAARLLGRALRAKTETDAPLDERFRDALADVVRVAAWPLASEERCLIALVGPAGVGKTTTAAKLAARAKMDGRSITLVAGDTFRVGAVEQLRRYATLLGAELAIAETAADLAAILQGATSDVVIVDTSGRAPNEDAAEGAIAAKAYAAIEHGGRARHTLLCLPAALRERDAIRAVKTFAPLNPTGLIVTKLDETDAPAGLVHATTIAKLPLTTLCFGQRVPEDIAPATSGAILDYLAPRDVRGAK